MSRLAIDRARQLHQRHPGLAFPVDMDLLANDEGCECLDWPFLDPVKEVKQGRWIGIAKGLPQKERRYLIAHALAHHLLHCGNQLSFRGWHTQYRQRQEQEADCCAAHILMPEKELANMAQLSLPEIAEYFGAPDDLVIKRMSNYALQEEINRWQSAHDLA